jgi:hypothetical protein
MLNNKTCQAAFVSLNYGTVVETTDHVEKTVKYNGAEKKDF